MDELTKGADFLPAVINILCGYGETCGAAIVSHLDIDKVAFVGSTAVGLHVMVVVAMSNLEKVALQLGYESKHCLQRRRS
ncbi:putative aldehyde dehydrogenase [Zalerion maritima]|uniref:aldehyde dehydrogenase (NAD(+)) n=1 Tax=Zalerion maritima TaxID=339359 RepID=A0AAD5WXA9_9PEZI|nr:putative aldehyde dehydrogenase [Zalerion maritima]